MGTDEGCMAWVYDEIGRAVGLPASLGGIPLDQVGATGFGLAAAIDVAADHMAMPLAGARVVVQGFGAVGANVARFLHERGCVLVAASDSRGAIIDPGGLDVAALMATSELGSVADHPAGLRNERDAVIGVECDIWIPAARPNVLHVDNVEALRTRLVAQGANIPATPEAEARLHERGILSLPDFIANAGGVICGAVEYAGGSQIEAFATIDERIRANTTLMLDRASAAGVQPREAALEMALDRLHAAMSTRRFR
jgi:glutamate dehydrogenase/leucine dehydrogenase